MKRKGVIFGFLLLMISGILLSSCIKENNGKTIALIGDEYYIEDILKMIPDSLQDKFETLFDGIPQGAIPADLGDSCSYVVSPNVLVSTNLWNMSSPIPQPDVYMRFSKQNNGIVVMELAETTLQKTDTVYVMGNNGDFTVYYVEEKHLDLDIYVKRGIVMCGKVADNGLSDFRMVFVVLEAGGEQAPNPGSYYYYEDRDGLAERCEWPWADNP